MRLEPQRNDGVARAYTRTSGRRSTDRLAKVSASRRRQSRTRLADRRADRRSPAARRRDWHRGARVALRGYRQATFLAVSLTALVLLVSGASDTEARPSVAQVRAETGAASTSASAPVSASPPTDASDSSTAEHREQMIQDSLASDAARDANDAAQDADVPVTTQPLEAADPQQSLAEATSTIRGLIQGTLAVLPKIAVAILLLLGAWLLSVLLRAVLRRFHRRWEKMEALSMLTSIVLFLLAIGAGLSVISGDATALVGSVGLVGLALSWALQTPIESFTGWVLNAFRGYYRLGDRIEVGEVFGDVYRIGVLATTVWESGRPGKAVSGAQPTGALITFPNWEILRSNIINYSRDFAYVWDEVTFSVANESDLSYTVAVVRKAADAVVGGMMREPAAQYQKLLERQRLSYSVEQHPQIYLSLADSWTNCTIRYLVPLRERRKWSSELILALAQELAKAEHAGHIIAGYPLTRIDVSHSPTGQPSGTMHVADQCSAMMDASSQSSDEGPSGEGPYSNSSVE